MIVPRGMENEGYAIFYGETEMLKADQLAPPGLSVAEVFEKNEGRIISLFQIIIEPIIFVISNIS